MAQEKVDMNIVVIGGGYGGIAAASYLAKSGHQVTLIEKNQQLGGRAQVLKDRGFTFDMGPSWYMMPDLFDRYFNDFGIDTNDALKLVHLDPAYEVIEKDSQLTISANIKKNIKIFENIETGAGENLKKYIEDGNKKYSFAKKYFLFNSYRKLSSIGIACLPQLVAFRPYINYDKYVNKRFKNPILRHTLKFMTVFLGGSPKAIPSLYSLLGYADMVQGIWYPMGGFGTLTRAMEKIAIDNGVKIVTNSPVTKIIVKNNHARGVVIKNKTIPADIVVANADYEHVETKLLATKDRSYSKKYWQSLDTSPSGLLFFLGVKGKINNIKHHTLFFDGQCDEHFKSIKDKTVCEDPLFYVSTPSVTDSSVAPKNHENMFILVPVASGRKYTDSEIDIIFANILGRLEKKFGQNIKDNIVVKHVRSSSYFSEMFNAFRGNSFGASHILRQSALFRPRLQSKKVKGLYYVGQYTNPGTGVPLVITSGGVVSRLIQQDYAEND